MIQFPLAWRYCRVVERMRPDLDRVWSVVRATTPRVHGISDETYMDTSLLGRSAEVYVQEQLKMAALTISDMVEFINIPDGYETSLYKYNDIKGNILVSSKKTGNDITDIDGLVSIAEGDDKRGRKVWHPFLVEVKIAPFKYIVDEEEEKMGIDKAYPNRLIKLIGRPLKVKGIKPVLSYFQDLYEKGEIPNMPGDIGMIVAMPPDNFNIIREGSLRRYVKMGGNFLRFPQKLDSYGQWIYAMADKYGFKIKCFGAA